MFNEAEEGRRGLWGIRISLLARVSRIYKYSPLLQKLASLWYAY